MTQYSQIDMIARSARMRGFNVLFPVGIDRNGLPVEIATERKYRIQLRKTPREEFIGLCRHALDDIESYMIDIMKKLAISGDFDSKYRTDSEEYRRLTQWSFIELWNKGLIYLANRPNNYCADCGTTIADAEVEYEELPTYLVTVRFRLKDSDEELLVATTRPELLVACQLIVVHPEDTRYTRFIGKKAVVPIYGREVSVATHRSVDPKFGTGTMMVCSYGDYNDVQLFREFKLKEIVATDTEGRMTSGAGKYAGLSVKDARSQILQDLQDTGIAVKVEQIQHRTPLCERSHTPIEIIPMQEFYLKQLEFRPRLRKLARSIVFHPDSHRQILLDWIDALTTDYPISRRRYYATEIPIWYCVKCNHPHIPEPAKYFRPWRDEAPFRRCKKCGGTKFVGESRTFDTWMDSSVSPLFITKFRRNASFHLATYPVTIRPQGKDIVRTWLYYTILKCYLLTGGSPFKHAWIGGLGLDAKGRAMRKSLGNFVDPDLLLQKYGSDTFRYWGAAEANQGYDFRLSEDRVAGAGKFLTKLWNTARYISAFPQPKSARLTPTDKWILSELYRLVSESMRGYEDFNVYVPAIKIREFLWNVFAAHYIEMTKGRAYGDGVSEDDQKAAWFTLHEVMESILLLLAPITPYITDHVWRKMYGTRSIHLESFPVPKRYSISGEVSQSIIDFNTEVWKNKKERGLAMKDSVEIQIPPELKPFEPDMVRMHHIIPKVDASKLAGGPEHV
jgi:valyl-tRNA synthetase